MRDCHLAAYQQAGLNPVAITSRSYFTAEAVGKQYGITKVHTSIDDLLKDESVEILDMAVPPAAQPDLIRRAVELGKGRLRGILAQKPLALSMADARDLVNRCEEAGIKLGVNQNMRYDQSIAAPRNSCSTGAT